MTVAVVEENETEKAEESRNKKKNKRKKIKKKEERGKAGVQQEVVDEKEVEAREEHALPVKSEKESIPARRRHDRKTEMRTEHRPKVKNFVKKSSRVAEIEDVVEGSDRTVEIERKFEDLSIEKENDRLESQNMVINGRNRGFRGYSGDYVSRGNSEYRGYNGGVNRGNGQYRGGSGRFDRGNGQYRRGYGRFNRENGQYRGRYGMFNQNGERKQKESEMVWVRKEEVADGGDAAGNQSSSSSLKELE